MAKLPVLSGHDLVDILKRLGFVVVRQKGSHVSFKKEEVKPLFLFMMILQKGQS